MMDDEVTFTPIITTENYAEFSRALTAPDPASATASNSSPSSFFDVATAPTPENAIDNPLLLKGMEKESTVSGLLDGIKKFLPDDPKTADKIKEFAIRAAFQAAGDAGKSSRAERLKKEEMAWQEKLLSEGRTYKDTNAKYSSSRPVKQTGLLASIPKGA